MMVVIAPQWCTVMYRSGMGLMTPDSNEADAGKSGHRLSISVNEAQYEHLAKIAHSNRVSIAWVVREAVDRLLKDDMPLLHVRNSSS